MFLVCTGGRGALGSLIEDDSSSEGISGDLFMAGSSGSGTLLKVPAGELYTDEEAEE